MNNWNSLKDNILKSIKPKNKNILVQAGHFSIIFNKKGNLIPAISKGLKDEKLIDFIENSNYMSDFPCKTFKSGIAIASYLKENSKNVKFTFIVNDWQWLNKGLYNFKTNRLSFYKKNKLPESYIKPFQKNNFTISDIINVDSYIKDSIFFSEQKLRKKGKKTVSDCSPESCAIEYIPFLNESMNDFDTLISFIPMSCKTPVLYSSIQYIKSCSQDKDLIHVFYDPLQKNIEISMLNKQSIEVEYENKINLDFLKMDLMSK